MNNSLLIKIAASFLMFFMVSMAAQAQHGWCLTDHLEEELAQQDPHYAKQRAFADSIGNLPKGQLSRTESGAIRYTIPVVFHIIYASANDNISKAQILDGLRVLNEDFQEANADLNQVRSIFSNDVGDVEVEFKLATKDPQGNCTDGITRTRSSLSINAGDNVKSLVSWNNDRYMNVWVVSSINSGGTNGIILGYAYLPRPNQSAARDGIVMRHDRLGTIGTSADDGRTLTHEVGHYLNLNHPFNGGCFGGDQVGDTPPVARSSSGCNFNANTCTNDNPDRKDQVENFMDYSSCARMFTNGQVTRMHNALNNNSLRGSLVTTSNLSFTGITNPLTCAPNPTQVNPSQVVACAGDSISFSEFSEDAEPTSWSWSFPGGSPASSSLENPRVAYSSPGLYNVTLTVSNASGSNTQTFNRVVRITRQNPQYAPTYVERLEGATVPPDLFIDSGFDQNSFTLTKNVASEGSQSLMLNNRTAGAQGDLDEIVLPAINTTVGTNLNFMFDMAFAAQSVTNDDELTIFTSKDCGRTWRRRKIIRNNELRTGGFNTSIFTPSAADWRTVTLSLNDLVQNDPVLIKLQFRNGGGNNLYIDYLRFGDGTSIGLEEELWLGAGFDMYPNPAGNGPITFAGRLHNAATIELTMLDVQGRKVLQRTWASEAGAWEQQLNPHLPEGLYLVELQAGAQILREKLLLQR